jgi:hypothetical protein
MLDHLRHEFQYWHPISLFSNGKDSISDLLDHQKNNLQSAFAADEYFLSNFNQKFQSTRKSLSLSEAMETFSADGLFRHSFYLIS